jgi:hypothetical protein
MYLSSKDSVDEEQYFVRKMKCRNNVNKRLDGLWATPNISSRLSSEQGTPQFPLFKNGLYPSCRTSLILFHTFAKCLLALLTWISLGSRKEYHICIHHATPIVLHPHKTLLRQLPHTWLSLHVKFVHYMNHALTVATDSATSSRGTRTWARTNRWYITAKHAFSCLCDEFKCSVYESEHSDDVKQIAS